MWTWFGVAAGAALVWLCAVWLWRRNRSQDPAPVFSASPAPLGATCVTSDASTESSTAEQSSSATANPDETPAGGDAEKADSGDASEPIRDRRRPILHSRHWAVLAGEPEPHRFLISAFEKLLQPGSGSRATGEGRYWHLVDNTGRLQLSALVRKAEVLEVLAIYPYAETSNTWPMELERIDESPDGLQARLYGRSGGAHFAVFDTLYFKNHRHYSLGETYDLQVSAIAYQLELDEPAEHSSALSGFGSLPSLSSDREAAEDEIVFHSTIEDVFDSEFWGIELQVYLITLLHTPSGPLRVEMYAHPSLAERRFAIGDRVRGVAWLFGLWPDPRATALAEALRVARLPN